MNSSMSQVWKDGREEAKDRSRKLSGLGNIICRDCLKSYPGSMTFPTPCPFCSNTVEENIDERDV